MTKCKCTINDSDILLLIECFVLILCETLACPICVRPESGIERGPLDRWTSVQHAEQR